LLILMKRVHFLILVLLILGIFAGFYFFDKFSFFETPKNQMSTDQKIGQMIIAGFYGTELTAELKDIIRTYHIGGVNILSRNVENRDQVKKLIAALQEYNSRHNSEPLFI